MMLNIPHNQLTLNPKLKDYQVVVVLGGISHEKEISKLSGEEVYKALKQEGINVVKYYLTEDVKAFITYLLDNQGKIIVFNALHGSFGEDGTLQSILDSLNIPYTHSNRTASTIGMHKAFTKKLLSGYNINLAKDQVINLNHVGDITLQYPFIVKPVDDGSSVGVYIVNNQQELEEAINQLKKYNKAEVLIEEYLEGREFAVGVLNGRPLAVTELVANKGKFYDYKSKYEEGGADHILPAKISKDKEATMLNWAKTTYKILNCSGLARVDFKEDANNKVYFLEINTNPGFTAISLFPEQSAYCGLPFPKLCVYLLNNAKGINNE